MGATAELLKLMDEKVQVSKSKLDNLEEICQYDGFDDVLKNHSEQYSDFQNQLREHMERRGEEPSKIGGLKQMTQSLRIKWSTLTNQYPVHLAELLIQDVMQSSIDLRKHLTNYGDAEKEIILLGEDFLEFQENTIEDYKKYL